MQWLMLQQDQADDYVIATGKNKSIKEFIELVARELGWNRDKQNLPAIRWEGSGLQEVGIRNDNNKVIIKVDKRYFRPSEVESLLGDPTKAINKLGWRSSISLEELIHEMVEFDKSKFIK